jgi:hypothetical protein
MHTDALLKMKAEATAEWGNQPCDHPNIVEEWYRGSKTGAYACAVCGRDVTVDSNGNVPGAVRSFPPSPRTAPKLTRP